MTTQKALMKIAEAYLTPFGDRTEHQKRMTRFGICHALYILRRECKPLLFYVGDYRGFAYGELFFTYTRAIAPEQFFRDDYDIYRGMFCLLLATMPEKDFKDIWRMKYDNARSSYGNC